MGGRPVWLASASLRRGREIVATGEWSRTARQRIEQVLLDVLRGVGDRAAERLFRMNVTLCVHRALTPEEEAALPPSFHAGEPVDLAGGPVEILRETFNGAASTRPCERPEHHILDPYRPDLWLPGDCGACEPCRARALVKSYCPTAMGAA